MILENLCVELGIFEFNLSPEIFVNLSTTPIKFSKDFFDPFNIKDASSAKIDVLFSFPSMNIPFISGLSLTWFDSSSMQIINTYGDKGQPCLTPRHMWKKSEW